MTSKALTPEEYLEELDETRRPVVERLRQTVLDNLPDGFQETMGYGMLGYVIPHSIYPAGYHCDPKTPLPFVNIASQKNFIALYHMGIYMMPEILEWFTNEYPKYTKGKLDMGKSCIRFKKMEDIPFDLIAQLIRKITVNDYVTVYETLLKR